MFCIQVELVLYKCVMPVTMGPTGFYMRGSIMRRLEGARPPPPLSCLAIWGGRGPVLPLFPLLPRYMWREGARVPPFRGSHTKISNT